MPASVSARAHGHGPRVITQLTKEASGSSDYAPSSASPGGSYSSGSASGSGSGSGSSPFGARGRHDRNSPLSKDAPAPRTPPKQTGVLPTPIIQTQMATPVGPSRSGGREREAWRATRSGSVDRVDEGLYLSGDERSDSPTDRPRRGSALGDKDKLLLAARERADLEEKKVLWLGDLEPWMDDNYMRQVCLLMGWKVEGIKLIRAAHTPASALANGQTPLNAGYCFVTFQSHRDALDALTTVTPTPTNAPVPMPSSAHHFKANWATGGGASAIPGTHYHASPAPGDKEFSVFIGDLSPLATEEDLVRVFTQPPEGIDAFESTVGAKIMRDPVSNASKLFGFVRFSSEQDQQRALAEMQGAPCIGRPMRVASASVKNRSNSGSSIAPAVASSAPSTATLGLGLPSSRIQRSVTPELLHPRAVSTAPGLAVLEAIVRPRSVTAPVSHLGAAEAQLMLQQQASLYALNNGLRSRAPSPGAAMYGLGGEGALGGLGNMDTLPASHPLTSHVDPQFAQLLLQIQALAAMPGAPNPNGPPVHHSVPYNDPNNTTVFVGGLSSLINEDALKMFFAPFGEIGYVRIPPGKSCGFVHFLRKDDANKAIERLQGFQLAGTKIRLSWGKPSVNDKRKGSAAAGDSQGSSATMASVQAAQMQAQLAQAQLLALQAQGYGGMGGMGAPLLQQIPGMLPTATNLAAQQQMLQNAAALQSMLAYNNTNAYATLGNGMQGNGYAALNRSPGLRNSLALPNTSSGNAAADQLMYEQLQLQQLQQLQMQSLQGLQRPNPAGLSVDTQAESTMATPPFQPFSPIPLETSQVSSTASYPSRLGSSSTDNSSLYGYNSSLLGSSQWSTSSNSLQPATAPLKSRSPSPSMLHHEHRRSRGETSPGIYGLAIPSTDDLPGSGSYLQRGADSLRASYGDLPFDSSASLGKTDFRQRSTSEAVVLGDAFKKLNVGASAFGNGAPPTSSGQPPSRSVSTSHANGSGSTYRNGFGGR